MVVSDVIVLPLSTPFLSFESIRFRGALFNDRSPVVVAAETPVVR